MRANSFKGEHHASGQLLRPVRRQRSQREQVQVAQMLILLPLFLAWLPLVVLFGVRP